MRIDHQSLFRFFCVPIKKEQDCLTHVYHPGIIEIGLISLYGQLQVTNAGPPQGSRSSYGYTRSSSHIFQQVY